jgi:hypothetical protein
MPIVQTVDYADFSAAFRRYERRDQFENLRWLYDYLEKLSDDLGQPVELDVIALCCEYSEESWDDVASNCFIHSIDLPDPADYSDLDEGGEVIPGTLDEEAFAEARREAILEYLRDNTSVCGYDDETVLYAQF